MFFWGVHHQIEEILAEFVSTPSPIQEKILNDPEAITVLSFDKSIDRLTGVTIFRGGVTAKYGVSIIKTDTLVVRRGDPSEPPIEIEVEGRKITLKPEEAYALGKIELEDPDVQLQASEIWISLAPLSDPNQEQARVQSLVARVGNLNIRATAATKTLNGWLLKNAEASTCRQKTPSLAMSVESVLIQPGKKAHLRGIRPKIFGRTIARIPSSSITLDRRTQGQRIPSINFTQQFGWGIQWQAVRELGTQAQLSGFLNSAEKIRPTFGFTYGFSRVRPEEAGFAQFVPQSDFGERTILGFFETIYSSRIEDQAGIYAQKRENFSFSTSANVGTFGRQSDFRDVYTKPFEVALETGGPIGNGWGYISQSRAMAISQNGGRTYARGLVSGSALAPVHRHGNLISSIRFDGGIRLDQQGSAWFGAEAGISYQANSFSRLSLGLYGFENFGQTLFTGDNFISNQGAVIRTDFGIGTGGATNLSLMWRYDPAKGWFDRQYRFSQVMGCIEPLVVYRENPNMYQFGLSFRLDSALNVLQQRQPNRARNSRKPIP